MSAIYTDGKMENGRHTVTLYSEEWNGTFVSLSSTAFDPRKITITTKDGQIVVDGERLAYAVAALCPPSVRDRKARGQ